MIAAIVVFVTTYALVLPAITLDVSRASQEPGIAFEQMQFKTTASAASVTAADSTVEVQAEETQVEEPAPEEPAEEETIQEEPAESSEEETSAVSDEPEEVPAEPEQAEVPDEPAQEEAPAAEAETEVVQEDKSADTSSEAASATEPESSEAQTADTQKAADQTAADQSGTEATEAAAAATTAETAADFQIPTLDALDFDDILTGKTAFYYYHPENAEEAENLSSDSIDNWKKAGSDTVLAPEDFVRVYLSYEIPAGALNETNTVARYRLPADLELSDKQIKAINKYENGIAASRSGSEHDKYLGAEAIEGSRTPDEKAGDEYISATVKVEKTGNGRQELVFTFIPYTIEKNQISYDATGKLTSEGRNVKGFFTFDLTTSQIDFENTEKETVEKEDGTTEEIQYSEADVVFVKENNDKNIDEISSTLTLATPVEKEEPKTLMSEGSDYTVTVSYTEEAQIPDNAELAVREIEKDTDEYASYLEQAKGAVDEHKSVNEARFFDITIIVDGEKVEPQAPVNVQITFTGIEQTNTDDTQLLHYKDDKEVEVIDKAEFSKSEDSEDETKTVDTVQFEAEGFSVYGIVGTELQTEVTLPGSDDTYEVSVTYGPEAKIPEGATLDVKAFEVDSEEYTEAKETVVAAKKAADEKFDEETLGFAALDITINDAQGKPVEPAEDAEVKVSFKMKKLPDTTSEEALANTLEIQHLNETNGTPEVETVAGVQDVLVTGGSAEAEFTITSFSTFTLTWGENSATVHFGTMNGTSFEEFEEETISFDTSANSINIANKFDGYTYQSAVYCTDGQSIEDGVDMDSIINKTSGGWQITQYTANDSGEFVPSQVNIVNGSDIYAVYYVPESSNPSGAGDSKIPSPTTTKTVTPNGDGTYTIQLDVAGATVTEDNSHYANILVILDATRSMRGDKWTNAKTAMRTLVETLVEGENAANAGKIDFALVTFGRSATVAQNWTKDNAAFKTACANMNMVSTSGTNWEAGMRGGLYGVLNNMPDDDPTFVIFLTDGDPNVYYSSGSATNYTDSGTTNGWNQNANTSATHSADEAKTIAANTYLYGIYCGDTGTTPSGESYNRLVNVITGSGQGGVKTIAANADTIESEFKAIAETALASMGANSVSVDDGVPSLSSVSAQTIGEAGAFEYYIATGENPSDSDFSTWSDAPGASYSNDNGVTWDLSKVGTLPEKTTYRLKFTVWPSQEAYDLIADLNNGVVTKTDAELEAANIVKGADGKYTLKTNSHLNTTYTFKNVTYTDDNQWTEKEMDLPTETLTVRKIWNNPTDWHIGDDSGNGVKLYLTKDGKNYLYGDTAITVAPDGPDDLIWEATKEIYISCGFIKQDPSTNAYEVLEDGHDYSIAEPESFAYYWDLTADVYHPMVINGTAHYLIQNDNASGTDGVNYYTIKGSDGNNHKYVLADSGDHVMTATNDRRSNLNLNKIINDQSTDQGADKDTLFEYTITVNNANAATGKASDTHSDYYVWFSVYDPVAGGYVTDLTTDATPEEGNTGYYYAPSGSPITVSIKEGWGLRFLNLPKDTNYTIAETVEDGWTFEGAAGSAIRYEKDASGKSVEVQETYNPTVNTETATISGTIAESNHSYTVVATNKWEPTGTELTVNKVWESGTFVTTHGTVTVALYKNGEVIPGTVKEIIAPATSVKYEKLTSLDNLEVREVLVTTEGTGEDAVTTVTPIDENGTIAVSGETTTLGSNATDTYVVSYTKGTAQDNNRTDTVTNTMPRLVVNKNGTGNDRLADAVFKLTGEDGETALSGYSTITSTGAESGNLLNGIYLSNGTYYLVETTAPGGYNKLPYKVKLEVGNKNLIITAVTDPASTTNISDETSDNKLLYTFTVHNSNGVELPMTGGPGTFLYTLGGITLIMASALMYGFRMRRRERRLK